MKAFLCIILSGTIFSPLFSQLKIAENFGGMTAGDLGTQNGWVVAGGGNHAQVTVLTNNTGALVYPGYSSGQNYVTANNLDGRDSYKPFNTSVPITSNSTTFISFVVRVANSANTTDDFLTLPSIALRTTNGENFGYFYIGDDGGSNLKFGIAKDEGGFGDGVFATPNYAFNTTYLIVLRYDVVTGTGNDNMYMWVNPGTVPEPTIASAATSVIGGSDGNYTGNISALQLFQQSFSFVLTWSGAESSFDAFRVANRPTSATAWADLSPAGAPLPVTLGSIKAFEKSSGIQIEWKAYSEINLSHYELERSANGITFTTIGQIAAVNALSETNYSFFDANSLPGISFYRLKSIDNNSQFKYSNIVRISLDKNNKEIRLYPNPVTGNYISFQMSDLARGKYKAKVFTVSGQQISAQQINHTGGAINQTIQLGAGIKSGVYLLEVNNGQSSVVKKLFMVQ